MQTLMSLAFFSLTMMACKDSGKLPKFSSNELKVKELEKPNGYGKEVISFYHDTIKHGKYESYNAEGKMTRSGFYYNDTMEGRWVFYDSLAQPMEIRYYHLNEPNGPDTIFFPNGHLKSTGQYLMGKTEGPWTYYYENGSIKSNMVFIDGMPQVETYEKQDSLPQ